jgi:TPP-dependent pyruvate/acetoin dehydrogenase alpha subunit
MTAKSTGEAGENPLVPNAKLRQMYTLMVEARRLEEAVAKKVAKKGKKRIANIRGQEAVRVSTAIELGADDLISDVAATAGMGVILGGDTASLLRGMTRTKADWQKALIEAGVSRTLGAVKDSEERLNLATGAALALKTQGRQGVIVVYAHKGELRPRAWRKTLALAQQLDLPMVFVALPDVGARSKEADLATVSDIAKDARVPGIPVDACDAVALYRVIQESLGRTRGGDGPVLIECVSWRVDGKRRAADDPLEHLKDFLLGRKICSPEWFGKAAKRRLRKK